MAVLLGAASPDRLTAQQTPSSADLDVVQLHPDFYVIAGAGANVAVQIGQDGVVVVDSGSSTHADRLAAAIRSLSPRPIRYIINTSADPDHVGGNAALSAAGQGVHQPGALFGDLSAIGGRAPVLAEEHVLSRMAGSTIPFAAWPTITYSADAQEAQRNMYLNGQAVQVMHQPSAHTDGDSIVFFRRSDVIVAGDVIDTTRFPVIDVDKGGSVQGVIDSLNRMMAIAVPPTPMTWQEGGTLIVPGHGRVYVPADLVDYRDMVTIMRDRVQDLTAKGMTLAEIQAANPAVGYRVRYGSESGAWTTNMFVESVHRSLSAAKGGTR